MFNANIVPAAKITNQFLFESDSRISLKKFLKLKLFLFGSIICGMYLCVEREETKPNIIIRKKARIPNFGYASGFKNAFDPVNSSVSIKKKANIA